MGSPLPIFYTTTEKLGSLLPIFLHNNTQLKNGVTTPNFLHKQLKNWGRYSQFSTQQHQPNFIGASLPIFFIILKIKIHILYLYFIIKLGTSLPILYYYIWSHHSKFYWVLESWNPEKRGYLNQTCRGVYNYYIIFLE